MVLGRKVPDTEPALVPSASVRDDEPLLLQGVKMIPHGTKGQAETPRELSQMEPRFRDDQGEDALT